MEDKYTFNKLDNNWIKAMRGLSKTPRDPLAPSSLRPDQDIRNVIDLGTVVGNDKRRAVWLHEI